MNKVLGRAVYASNLQIGGPQIMFNNGVTHALVKHDLAGIQTIVDWLAYIPEVCLLAFLFSSSHPISLAGLASPAHYEVFPRITWSLTPCAAPWRAAACARVGGPRGARD